LLNGNRPKVFEDGRQTRDFTHVSDVAEAFVRAVEAPIVDGCVLNVGAGRFYTLDELGRLLAREIGVEWDPEITHAFRAGDIRHCTADSTRLERTLGFKPRIDFTTGVKDLMAWVRGQRPADQVDRALAELNARGLVR
jgi:dTDP-L-rhamnose 4-epimerase